LPGSACNAPPLYHAHSFLRYHSDDFLFESVLEVVDEALGSAAGVTRRTSRRADLAFKKAIEELDRYEMERHHTRMVNERMAAARARDITMRNFFKRLFSPKVRLGRLQLLHLI
jgi:hypothetical protein